MSVTITKKPSRTGTLVDGIATLITSWVGTTVPSPLLIIPQRVPAINVAKQRQLYVVPGQIKVDFQTRRRRVARDVAIRIFLTQQLEPRSAAQQVTLQDDLIAILETIVDEITMKAASLIASDNSFAWALHSIDDQPTEPLATTSATENQQFIAPFDLTYFEEAM